MSSPGERLRIERGDITTYAVDAVVNAANRSLLGGGGVDGAIHRQAGPRLREATAALGECPTGEARITPGFGLPAHHVIHTVGPVWEGGGFGEEELLASSYVASLELAEEHELATIAFPSISTGAYRFPVEKAAPVAVREITDWLAAHALPEEVVIVCYDEATFEAYRAAAREALGRDVTVDSRA